MWVSGKDFGGLTSVGCGVTTQNVLGRISETSVSRGCYRPPRGPAAGETGRCWEKLSFTLCRERGLVNACLQILKYWSFGISDFYRITESQNVRGWQGPLWVTQPNPLPKQGHPEQAAQDLVQAGVEYLQRRRLHSLPGQPEPKQAMGRFVWFETCVENARGRKTSWERSNQQLQPRIEASTVNAAWQSCGLSWNCCFNGEDCQIVL